MLEFQLDTEGKRYKALMDDCRREIIRQALAQARGRVPQAADRLGIQRANIYRLMRKFSLQRRERRAA